MVPGEAKIPLRFTYRFGFPDGETREFEVVLDNRTLELLQEENVPKPEWTKLYYSQCEGCPLGTSTEYCPVAVNLAKLVDKFKDSVSFENTTITVETPERTYVRDAPLQKGLSSLIGLIMVTSGCPVMDKLRPMARFHLPFANSTETFYRALSMYLVAQLLLMRKGKKPDWELKNLVETYKQISLVNKGMSKRLSSASNKDANVNAMVILHAFGEVVPYFIENGLRQIEELFSVYLKQIDSTVDV